MKNKFCDLKFWYQFTNARIIDIFSNTCFNSKLVEVIHANATGGSNSSSNLITATDGSQWYSGLNENGQVVTVLFANNYLNDAAAATGGILVGQYYHTNGIIKKRIV